MPEICFAFTKCSSILCKIQVVTCLDQNGNKIWNKEFRDSVSEYFGEYIVESDSGYYVLGTKRTDPERNGKVWILKLNYSGDTIWTKTFDAKYEWYGGGLSLAADGGALACINVDTSSGGGYSDLWLLRLKSNGDTLWTKYYDYKDMFSFNEIIITDDNGFLGAGVVADWTNESSGVIITKFDQNGDTVWLKEFPYDFNMYTEEIQKVGNDGYVIAGGVNARYVVFRIGNNGETKWVKQYGNIPCIAMSIKPLNNGNFMLCGRISASNANDDWDIQTLKINRNGDSLTSARYVTSNKEYIDACRIIDENDLIVCSEYLLSNLNCNAIIYKIHDSSTKVMARSGIETLKYQRQYSSMFDLKGRLVTSYGQASQKLSKGLYVVKNSSSGSVKFRGSKWVPLHY